MINKGLFSSNSNEWETPKDLFDTLNGMFNFTLDPCASDDNHKCKRYFTKTENGLAQTWVGNVFVNPPYGREIGKWIEKAWIESFRPSVGVVVCLIPARTDTIYWHRYVMKAKEIWFIRGRIKFGNSGNSAPFPSAIVIFKRSLGYANIRTFDLKDGVLE